MMPRQTKKLSNHPCWSSVYSRVGLIGMRIVLGVALGLGMSCWLSGAMAIQVAQDAVKPKSTYKKPKPKLETQSKAKTANQNQPQQISPDLLVRNQPIVIRAEAFAGRPYGVGKVKFRLQLSDQMIERVGATLLTDNENRIFYPVITRSAVRAFLGGILGGNQDMPDDAQTVWFLFKGDAPLNLTLQGSGKASFQVPVEFTKKKRQFERTHRQWWQTFTRVVNEQAEDSDYPPLVETYLQTLLGSRMGLEVPQPSTRKKDPLTETYELMFDVETLRNNQIRELMLRGVDLSPADRPMPAPIEWSTVRVDNLPAEVEIEPIAKCVPEECFYLRFGTWQNQLWLQRLLEEYGGDLSRMIQVRGFKAKIQSKFLNQLAIQSNEFDRLFGGSLIDDVAVVGTDTYFDDGSAVGVMLHAKATERLEKNLRTKRAKFAKENTKIGAKIVTIPFGDESIEFLSTPDNRYRSFYAVSGDCHLMTTSLVIARRFLEAGRGIGSLANSPEYRFARFNRPLEQEDTIFVYLSTRFFQQLLTPQYQIELRRRNRIVTDMTLLELASLASRNEGQFNLTVPRMIQGGYLPQGFGYRPDGGTFETVDDNLVDSIRGRRGFFTPIPDLPLNKVTAEEASWFQERATFFAQSIRTLDPMFIAIKRYEHRENVERVVFDSRLAPFGEEKYGWLMSMLGPPLENEVARAPDDIIRLQASVRGGRKNPEIPAHQIFAAVQDRLDPTVDLRPSSFMKVIQALREAPGYLGAWPSPGYTNWMPALGRQPDQFGYTYSRLLKLWKLQWGQYSVLSFDQSRLESLKPHLKVVDRERPSQVRLEVGDLVKSNLRGWANSVNYRRSWQTSVANVRLLNLVSQQFRVPPESARAIVERMLGVELVCSLGGEYRLAALPSGRKVWHSTAWPSFTQPEIPEGHTAPVLKWFRGLEIEVSKGATQFSVHGFVDIERNEAEAKLPSFDLFKGFSNLFGGGNKSGKKSGGKDDQGDGKKSQGKLPQQESGPK